MLALLATSSIRRSGSHQPVPGSGCSDRGEVAVLRRSRAPRSSAGLSRSPPHGRGHGDRTCGRVAWRPRGRTRSGRRPAIGASPPCRRPPGAFSPPRPRLSVLIDRNGPTYARLQWQGRHSRRHVRRRLSFAQQLTVRGPVFRVLSSHQPASSGIRSAERAGRRPLES